MATENDLRLRQSEAHRLRSSISQASGTVADKRKKAADARAAAARSKSASTVRMKTAEADRCERDANAAERKRADLEKKLATCEQAITKIRADLEKKRLETERRDRAKQQSLLDDLRRRHHAAEAQFRALPAQVATTLPRGFSADALPGSTSLAGEAEARAATRPASVVYDVFISHASEDKDEIARPLKEALEARGLAVWFDEIQIKVGQSIRQEIEKGIATARFGVVIVSPDFFRKQWTRAELDALFARKMDTGDSLILPVWHHVSKDEVLAQSPLLAGVLALNSAVMTVDEMADELLEVVRPSEASS